MSTEYSVKLSVAMLQRRTIFVMVMTSMQLAIESVTFYYHAVKPTADYLCAYV